MAKPPDNPFVHLYQWVIASPLRTALSTVVILVLLIGIPVSILLVAADKTFVNDRSPGQKTTSGNTNLAVTSTPQTPQDILAQWKADPKYQNPPTVPYADLFRNADQYKGQFVHFKGEVIQVLGSPGNWNLRVNVTPQGTEPYIYWQDTAYVFSFSQERVIDKDIIEFTGLATGVYTYQSTFGTSITIPSLTIHEHQVVGRGR